MIRAEYLAKCSVGKLLYQIVTVSIKFAAEHHKIFFAARRLQPFFTTKFTQAVDRGATSIGDDKVAASARQLIPMAEGY